MPGRESGDYIGSMSEGDADLTALEREREAYEPSWYRVLASMEVGPPHVLDLTLDTHDAPRTDGADWPSVFRLKRSWRRSGRSGGRSHGR